MKLISSSFNRRFTVVAVILGMAGFLTAIVVPAVEGGKPLANDMFIFPVIFFLVIGTYFWKFWSGLAEQVWDDGNSLLIKKGGQELRVPLSEIINVNYSAISTPRGPPWRCETIPNWAKTSRLFRSGLSRSTHFRGTRSSTT